MRQLTNSLFFTLGTLVGSQVKLRLDTYQQPYPMPHQWGRLLAHPWRLQYRKPAEMVANLGILPQMTVLDLGCGTGVFTAELARLVGDGGTVHAVDLQAALLRQAQQRLQGAGFPSRVHYHHCGAYELPLQPDSIDLALVIATLGQIPDKPAVLRELYRVLKPGARLVISEELPDPAYVAPPLMRRWLAAAGYRYIGQSGNPFCYTQLYLTDKEPNTIDVVAKVVTEPVPQPTTVPTR
ncbi:MAG: methyltransferase domain-containing protein [Caldilineaceae bacterium]|nr:methyltransferase domain-containing protein [Caldilineaceae bacterium]